MSCYHLYELESVNGKESVVYKAIIQVQDALITDKRVMDKETAKEVLEGELRHIQNILEVISE